MSAYSTSSPSIEHTRWYLIRPPSLACTCRNDTSCDSVAEYSLTGTLTSPNDTAPFQIARISYLRVDDDAVQYRPAAPRTHARRRRRPAAGGLSSVGRCRDPGSPSARISPGLDPL